MANLQVNKIIKETVNPMARFYPLQQTVSVCRYGSLININPSG